MRLSVSHRQRLQSLIVAIGVWSIGALFYFRETVTSGFDEIMGDRGDVRFIVFVHEHWLAVLRGERPWRDLPIFHPLEGTLGMSDSFLLDTVVYVPLRVVGFEPFLAFQVKVIIVSLVGHLALVALLRRVADVPMWLASTLSAVVVFSNVLAVHSGHPQLMSTSLLAVVVLLVVRAVAGPCGRRSVIEAFAAGLLLGLLFSSTYYAPWMVVFGVSIVAVVWLALRARAGDLRAVMARVRERGLVVVVAVTGLVLGLVPFILVYVPVLLDHGTRSFDEVAGLSPAPLDVVNVGGHNLMWRSVVQRLFSSEPWRLSEPTRAEAVTPVLLVTAIVAIVVLTIVRPRRAPTAADVARGRRLDLGLACAVTAVVLAVAPLHWSWGGPWWVVWRFVPGATGVRAPGRVTIVATAFAVVALAIVFVEVARRGWARASGLLVALVVFVAVEQIHLGDRAQIDRTAESARLDAVPPLPVGCRYVVPVSPTGQQGGRVSSVIDVMLVADRVGVPTISGYTGLVPDGAPVPYGWDDYDTAITAWVGAYGLDGVCGFDTSTWTWQVPWSPSSGS